MFLSSIGRGRPASQEIMRYCVTHDSHMRRVAL